MEVGARRIPWAIPFFFASFFYAGSANCFDGGGKVSAENMMKVTVRVAEERGMLVAETRFENIGNTPVYVMRGFNGYGEPTMPDEKPGTLMDPEFQISCNGQPLRYVGRITKWAPPQQTDFDPIAPGRIFELRRIRIDDLYRFGDGVQACRLTHRHLEFDPVTHRVLALRSLPTDFTYTRN
jgi:hypothetical protein